jgi:hypothetical protein
MFTLDLPCIKTHPVSVEDHPIAVEDLSGALEAHSRAVEVHRGAVVAYPEAVEGGGAPCLTPMDSTKFFTTVTVSLTVTTNPRAKLSPTERRVEVPLFLLVFQIIVLNVVKS